MLFPVQERLSGAFSGVIYQEWKEPLHSADPQERKQKDA